MGDEYRRMRTKALERWRVKHGDKPMTALMARHVAGWMDEIAATPHAANDLRKMLNQLMKYAIRLGLRTDNPVAVVDPLETDGEGYHCWTEDEIAAFDRRWPVGTRERLAKKLLLLHSTASQRHGDRRPAESEQGWSQARPAPHEEQI
ncbi:MAG TPA: hypothetical protein VNS79_12355 [Sphingobium sp.]|nr:hypothetical protein [Sphingobium sp.]